MALRQKYDNFMKYHPKIEKTKNAVVLTGYIVGAVAVLLGILSSVGYTAEKIRDRRYKSVLKPDDRKATLIGKNEQDHLLFLDTDGNTNTVEMLVRYETTCPTTVIGARQAKVGEMKKISEWKGSLVDKCWEKHFEWIDMTTKGREKL